MNSWALACLRGLLHLRVGGILPAESNVLADRIVEQIRVLRDERHPAAHVVEPKLVQSVALHHNVALVRVPEAHHQIGDGSFAGARAAYDGHGLPRPYPERHVSKCLRIAFRVGKGHVLKLN